MPKVILISVLIKLLIPLGIIAVVVLRARKHWGDWRERLAIRKPPALASGVFLLMYAGWMLGSNALWHWRGPWDFTVWRQASLAHDAARIAAVGILGPIAEELVFRGLLYGLIARTRAGHFWAIIATAVLWALIHVQYAPWIILIILVDGLLLGCARRFTHSVVTCSGMHVLWNLYAVW